MIQVLEVKKLVKNVTNNNKLHILCNKSLTFQSLVLHISQ